MTDERDRFEEVLKTMSGEYNLPQRETPREEMWTKIRAKRTAVPSSRRTARRRWVGWGLAAAATLAVGIGIGRITAGPGGDDGPRLASAAPDTAAPAETEGGSVAYEVAAGEHLSRVEAFLTLFRADARAGRTPDVTPARALLINTRLLQQSPAVRDPTLRAVLDDVELVLAQIALYESANDGAELELITEGMEQRDVLLKLRSATAEQRRAGGPQA